MLTLTEMKTIEVRCTECRALPGVMCRKTGPESEDSRGYHRCRVELAQDWSRLFSLGESLGADDTGPDLHEVEFLVHFGSTPRERRVARELMDLAERVGYTEPGDQEAA